MSEKFSIVKLLDFSPIGFYKVIGLSLKAAVLLLIVLGVIWIKNMLFTAAPSNVNTPNIKVESGGKVEYKVTQNEQKRRLEYFAGAYGDKDRVGLFGGVKF